MLRAVRVNESLGSVGVEPHNTTPLLSSPLLPSPKVSRQRWVWVTLPGGIKELVGSTLPDVMDCENKNLLHCVIRFIWCVF